MCPGKGGCRPSVRVLDRASRNVNSACRCVLRLLNERHASVGAKWEKKCARLPTSRTELDSLHTAMTSAWAELNASPGNGWPVESFDGFVRWLLVCAPPAHIPAEP
jgi:hypothetical protein